MTTRPKPKPTQGESKRYTWTICWADGTVRSTVHRKTAAAAIKRLGRDVAFVHCERNADRNPKETP